MKTPRRRFPLSRAVLLTAAFLLPSAFAQTAPATNALPGGGQVAAGQVTMATTGAPGSPTLNVTQGSDRAIVNWQTFDVGRDATVRFAQPSATSAILNRVVGTDASRVFGRIEANGQVFLVNPQGVYFGPGASVDVGSFVASTLAIGDADFLAGRLNFRRDGATGSVVNEGTIRGALGGYVALLAPEVRNAGLIMAETGTVVLAAGEAVSFNFDPAAGVTGLLVDPARVQALVDNRRIVRAPGGQVIVSAQAHNELAAGVIRNTGEIVATGIAQDGGRVFLGASDTVEQGGLVDASAASGKGGDVTVVAPTIKLLDQSSLLADGELGGGRIRVGGEWQGGGTLPQSRLVTMAATALVDASARSLGAGGEVVLWSDIRDTASLTQVAGTIRAFGGALGGDGGRIETSGHVLDSTGAVVLAGAPAGRGGLWLIDPADSVITAAIVSGYQTTLNSGTSVLNDVVGTMDWVSGADLVKSAGGEATLTLRATGRVSLSSNISSTAGKLNLVFWSDSDNTLDAGVTIGQVVTFSTNGGHLWIGGGTAGSTWSGLAVGAGASRGSSGFNSNGTDLRGTFNTAGGNIRIAGASTANLVGVGIADVYLGWLSGLSLNAGSGNIEIYGDKITAENASSVTTTGTLTIAPWSTAFFSAFTWGTTLTNPNTTQGGGANGLTINSPSAMTGLVLGKTGNTAGLTVSSAISLPGPISLYAGDLTLNAGLTSTASGAAILLKATSGILTAASQTVQTNGGDIVYWADSGGVGSGNRGILISDGVTLDSRTAADRAALTHTTDGGMIVLGGGSTTATSAKGTVIPTGYALNYTSSSGGLILGSFTQAGHDANIAINSGGGNVVMRGRSTVAFNNLSVGILVFEGVNVNAGTTGDITLDGVGTGTGTVTCGYDFQSWRSGADTSTFRTVNGNILLQGSASGGTSINIGGSLLAYAGKPIILAATGSGNVSLLSTTTGSHNDFRFSDVQLLSGSGTITVASDRAGGTLYSIDQVAASALRIGQSAGSLVTSSTANVVLRGDVYNLTGTGGLIIDTAGTVALTSFNTTGFTATPTIARLDVGRAVSSAANSIASFTLGRTTNTSAITLATGSVNAQGPIRMYGSNLTIGIPLRTDAANAEILLQGTGFVQTSANFTTTGSASPLRFLAGGYFNSSVASTWTTGGSDVLVAANTDATGGGYIYASGNQSIVTSGGAVTMGGGDLTGSGYAEGMTSTTAEGIRFWNALSIDTSVKTNGISTGGGDITLRGRSALSVAAGNGAWGVGVDTTTTFDSGSGNIRIDGISRVTSGDGWSVGVRLHGNATLSSASTSATAIHITGTGANLGGSGAYAPGQGLRISGGSNLLTTTGVGGGIKLSGTTTGDNWAVVFEGGSILSASGPIELSGTTAAGKIYFSGTPTLGFKAGTAVTASTANILLVGDDISWGGGVAPVVATSGTFTYRPAGTTFSRSPGTNWYNLPTTLSALTIGSATNTSQVFANTSLTVQGPITLQGGNVEVSQPISAAGNILLDGDTGANLALSIHGVRVEAAVSTTAASNGNITLTGRGGNTASNWGVYLSAAGTLTAGGSGAISITGIGGANGGIGNHGIISYANLTTTTGSLTLNGTGVGTGSSSMNRGIQFIGNVVLRTTTGTMTLTGTGGVGANSDSFYFNDAGVGTLGAVGQSGDITIRGNNLAFGAGNVGIITSGSLTIEPTGTSFTSALSTAKFTLPALLTSANLGKNGNTADITVASAIATSGGITITGGAVALNGALSSTGGDIGITTTALTGASGITIPATKTLTITQSGTSTYDGAISGGGSLVKAGAGTLALSASSGFTGTTSISAGTLALGGGGTSGWLTGTTSIAVDGTLQIWRGDDVTLSLPLTGAGTIEVKGAYRTLFNSYLTNTAQTVATNTTVAEVMRRITGGYLGGTSVGGNAGPYQVTFDPVANVGRLQLQLWDGQYVKTVFVRLVQSGTNVQALVDQASPFSNGTAYTTQYSNLLGQDMATAAGITYSMPLATSAGATGYGVGRLDIAGKTTLSNIGSFAGSLRLTTSTEIGAASSYTRTIPGILEVTSGFGNLSGIVNNGLLYLNQATDTTLSNAITGTGGLFKLGTGNTTFAAAASFTGETTVAAGRLTYQNAYGSSVHTILAGATLALDTAVDRDYAATTFRGTGTLVKSGAGRAQWGTSVATFALGTGAMIDVQGGIFTGSSNSNEVWTNNFSDLNVASDARFAAVEGAVRIDALTGAGDVTVGFAGGLGSLALGVDNHTAGAFSTAGSATFSGVIADTGASATGAVTKLGTGTQIFSGANTFTRGTTLSAGTLRLGAGGTAGSLAGNIVNNAGLVFDRSDALVYAGVISGAGTVTKLGSDILTFTGANTYSGVTTISAGTLRVGNGASAGTLGTGAITNNGILNFRRTNLIVVPGVISGTGSVTSAGGIVALTGANTYSGGTTITGGTIGAYHNTALGTGTLTIGGATLLIGRTVTTIANALTLTGAVTADLDASVEYLIVGGGGSGVDGYGGGGGAGGFLTGSMDLTGAAYAVTVGTGGAQADRTGPGAGNNGISSTAFGLTALGGGAGGTYGTGAPTTGGSGGGGGANGSAGAAGTAGQGNAGGAGNAAVSVDSGGGGGGAGGAGGAALTSAGAGGAGLSSTITGELRWYAGGGGGSAYPAGMNGGAGGIGGGGGGASNLGTLGVGGLTGSGVNGGTATRFNGGAGAANSGGGGGGGQSNANGYTGGVGGAGGSGIIVARYLGPSGGTGGTITAGTNLAAGYTLHTFTTTGAATLTLSALSATLSGAVTGTGNLTADATGGTLIFSGANTYDGTTTIPGGTVRVGAGGATGALGAGAITNNGSLIFNRTGTLAVGSVISGTGTLEQAGGGTTVLEGVNTYSGATTVTAGTLAVTDAAGLGTTAAGTTVASGATLDLRNVLVGAETLALNGGTLATSTGTSSLGGAVTLGASSTLNVGGTQLTLGGVVSGATFGLTKSGAGLAILNGVNTFTGDLAVNAGTLRIGGAGTLASGTYVGAITVASGATFDFASSANQIFGTVTSGNVNNSSSNTLRGAGKHVFGGSGAVTLRGDFSASGTIDVSQSVTMTGGTNTTNAGLGQAAAIDIKDGGTITLAGGANSFIGGSPNTIVLTLRTGGKLTTSGAAGQTFHLGPITFAGGELATGAGATTTIWGLYNLDRTITVTEDSTLSAQFSAMYQAGGTVFNVAAGKTLTVSGTLNLPSNGGETGLVLNSAAGNTGTMVLTGTNTYAGTTTITRGTLRIGGAGSLGGGTYANTVTNNGALEIATSANQTFSNVISGSGSVTKSGAGTTTLTATNTYTGATTVSAGVLQVGNGGTTGALSASSAASIASGATLRYFRTDSSAFSVAHAVSGDGTLEFRGTGANGVGSFKQTGANTLSSSAVMLLNQAVLSVGTQAELSPNLPLVRIMSGGLLYVERGGTYGNPLELGDGLGWKFGDASQLGLLHANAWVAPGAVNFTGNVTLTGNSAIAAWANSSDLTMSGVISDGGNGFGFTKLGALKLTLTGANTFTGTTTIGAGTLQVGAGGAAGVLGGPVVNNSALIFDRSDALTFAHAISGTGTLTKAGANALTLTGASTYAGSTAVTGGSIVFRRDAAPSTSGFTGAGTVTIESAGAAFTSPVASYTYASTLTGLTIGKPTNTSAVTLGSAVTIAGPVTVYGGNIAVNAAVSAAGNLLLDADTGAQLTGNFTGLAIAANLSTTAGSNGSITLRGRGGDNSAGGQNGVNIATGLTVTAGGTGALLIEGTGGASVGSSNIGIRSYGTLTTGSGDLTLTGIAGGTGASSNNDGIAAMGGSIFRSVGGALLLDGANGPGVSSESIAFETASSALTFGQISQTGSTTLRGDVLWVSTNNVSLLGSGAITIEPKGASFGSALATDKFTLPSTASAFTFGKAGNTAALTVASNLSIAGPISVFGGDVTLSGGLAATAAGDLLVRSSGVLTIAASRVLSTTNGDVTVTAARLVNNSGSGALSAGGTGKTWRVWSTNADPYHVSTGDVVGGLAFDFRQYDASYGVTAVQGTGKGLLYSYAPTLSASFTTTPTKVYDRTDTATVTDAMVTVASGYAGGDVTAVFGFSAATYASRNAGNGQAITFASAPTVIAQSSAGTGGKPVYGYRISGLSAPTGNITPRPLTLTGVTAANKVYDRALAAVVAGGAVTPLSGDTVTVDTSALTGAFADWNVGSSKAVTVAGAVLGGADAGNYTVGQPAGLVANITARPLAVTGVSVTDKVYDRTLTATLAGGLVTALSGDTVSLVAAGAAGSFADWNVGTGKVVTASGYALSGAQAGNYAIVQPTGLTGVITPRPLAVTGVAAANKVYDRTVSATLSGGAVAPLSGDTVTLDTAFATGVFADRNVGTAKAITASGYALDGVSAGNYAIVQPAGVTANITPATLQVQVNSDAKFVSVADPANFNGVSLSGFLAGDTLADVTGSATITRSNAGVNAAGAYAGVLTASGLTAQNYVMNYVPGDFTIVPADRVLVRVTSETVTYGNAPAANIESVQYFNGSTGLVVLSRVGATNTFDDGVAGGNGTVTFSVVAANPLLSAGGNLRVGTYGLDVDAGSLVITGTNFSGTPVVSGSLNVIRRSVQVAGVTAADRAYDGNTGATVTGGAIAALSGDAVGVSAADVVASFADKNAASGKSVTATGYVLTGADASNYQLVQPTGITATITPRTLNVTGATAANKTYDALRAATISGGVVSVIAGDAVTLDASNRAGVFADKHAGAGKLVTVTGYAISGADAANYALAQPAGVTADITQLTLNVTGATAANKTYDALLGATVSGGAISALAGDTVTLVTAGRAGVFADKNVGTGKAVTVTGYTISGADAANYALAQPTGLTADITPRTLNVTGVTAANKTYDALLGATVSGGAVSALSGDTVTLDNSGRAGVFADKNVGTGKVVTVTGYVISGTDAGNYSLVQPTGVTANISALALSVTGATAANKTYDGLLAATVSGGAISALAGDTVTLVSSGRAGVFADKNVGAGKSVTVTGYTLSGADAGNYSLVQPAGVTADITQRALNVTGATAANKTYDALLGATISGGAISAVSGDVVTLVTSGRTGVFADKNVGAGKAVTVSGYIISGADAGNYTLVQPAGVTADITALTLNVTGATAANKTYDALLGATISGGAISVIDGDAVTLDISGRAGAFADKHVGTGKAVSVSGYAISGADAGNYALAQPTGLTANITVRSLSVTGATAANKSYDALLGATISGGAISVLGGDAVTLVTTGRTGVFADKNVGVGKTVTVTGYAISGADAGNYALVQPTGVSADITRLTLNVTGVTAANKVYDRTVGATLSGGAVAPLSGDTVTLDATYAAGVFADRNVGTAKPVSVSGFALGGADAANYAVAQPAGVTADITPATLQVVVKGDAKFVSTADPANFNGVTLSGFLAGDTLADVTGAATITRTNAGVNAAGTYAGVLTASGLTAQNYVMNYVPGDFTIVPADRVLVRVTSESVTYGTAPAAEIESVQYFNGSTGLVVLSRVGSSSTFDDGVLGGNGTVTFSVVAANPLLSAGGNLRVGTYGLEVDAGSLVITGTNFSGTPVVTGSLSVTPLSVQVGGITAANKSYDGNIGATVTGGAISELAGDAVAVSTAGVAASFADKNAALGKTVTAGGYALTGADAANYRIVQPAAVTADITPLTLNVTGATAANKTYDALLGATISGGAISVLAGDTVVLDATNRAGVFADKNVGTGKAVTVTGYAIAGADAANYALVQPTGVTADITPLALNVTGATAANKTYDALLGAVISGGAISVIGGDTVTLDISGRAGVFADKHVGSAKTVTVSGYAISGADAANYALVQPTGVTADITRLALNVTGATAANKTYDALLAATVSGGAVSAISGDVVTLVTTGRTGVFADKHVGAGKAVMVTGYAISGADAGNYSLVQPAGVTADITPLTLNVTGATAANKTYDALLGAVISGGTISAIGGDTVTLDISGRAGAFADKNVANGKAVTVTGYTIAGADAANYSLVQPTGVTADITPLTLNVTGATAANKTYDALLGAVVSGGAISVIGGDAVTLVTSARSGVFADKNVGTGKAVTVSGYTITGVDAANYSLVQPTGVTADITALTLNVTGATAANKTYDALRGAVISGGAISAISGDDVSLVTSVRTGVFADKNVGTGKAVTVSGYTITGADAGNYDLVQPTGVTADITPLALNVTGATAADKTYDALRAAVISGGAVSAIGGDAVTLVTSGRTGLFADKHVGTTKAVTVSGYAITGADAGNYALAQPTGVTADITPLTLNVTGATAASKTYDALLGAVIAGGAISAIGGDAVVLDTTNRAGLFADKHVGNGKAVTVSGYALTGADAGNYALAQPTGVHADITWRTLSVTGATAADKTYDRTVTATISGGVISPISGDVVTLATAGRTGVFADKNVGTGKSVTVSGYAISGADAGNYALAQPTGVTATITPLTLNVTGATAANKTYDALVAAAIAGGSISVISGDAVTLVTSGRAGAFADKNVGAGKAVTVSGYALTGADAGNYALVQPTGVTADITPLTLNVTGATAANKTYDALLAAVISGGTVAPITGDTVLLDTTNRTGLFGDKNVANGKAVTVTGYTISGSDAANYSLVQPIGVTADITPLTLNVTGATAANKTYDALLGAVISGGAISAISGDDVVLDPTNRAGLFADKNVAIGKAVTVTGYAISGADAANYSLVQPTGLTADITPLALNVTGATAANKVYDALLGAVISGGAISAISGDTVVLDATNRAGLFGDKNVGNGKAVTVTGYTISGTDAANYSLVQPTGVAADITPLTLNVTGATAANKTYDALLGAVISGGAISAISGDTVILDATNRAGVFGDKNVADGKAVTVSGYAISGADAANYSLVQPLGVTADITPLTLNVNGASAANKTYDALLAAVISGGTVAPISGDTVLLDATNRAGLFGDKNVGSSKAVTVTGYAISGTDAANYALVQPVGLTADITPLALNVTGATAANKVYDALLGTSISGGAISAIAGDIVNLDSSGRTGVFADKNVANGKAVTVTGYTISGTDAGNYALVQPTGVTADITPLTLNVTGATAANKTYDALLGAAISGGAVSAIAGDSVDLDISGRTGVFADKNVANGKAVTVTGYTISGTDAANYTLVQPTGLTADITPLTLNVTGATAANKTYDALVAAAISGGAISVIAGDSVDLDISGRTGVFADKNVANGKAVTVTGYAISGADAANYSLVQPTGLTADITPLALNVTGATAANKVYDALLGTSISGGAISAIAGDIVNLDNSGRTGVFADKNVANGKAVTVTGYTISGTDAGNYALVQPTGLTADITPLTLNVTGATAANKVYDALLGAAISGGVISAIAGDSVDLDISGRTGVFADKNVANGKAVTVTGYTISGTDAANYSLVQPTGVAADITPLTLNVTGAFASNKTYDALVAAAISGGAISVIAGDVVILDSTSRAGVFGDKNVGTSKPVNVSGYAISGIDAANYALVQPIGLTADIAPRTLNVTGATAANKTYDALLGAVISGGVISAISGDVVNLDGSGRTGVYADKNVGTGKVVTVTGYTISGPDAANYALVQPTGLSADIFALSLPVQGVVAANKLRNGSLVAEISGGTINPLAGDSVTLDAGAAVGLFLDDMVGMGKPVVVSGFALTGADALNYALVQPTGLTADINDPGVFYPPVASVPTPVFIEPLPTIWAPPAVSASSQGPASATPQLVVSALSMPVSAPDIVPVGALLSLAAAPAMPVTEVSIEIVGGFVAGDTLLQVAAPEGLKVSVDNATGKLTITGQGSSANYEKILKSLAVRSAGGNRVNALTLRVGVNAGQGGKSTTTVQLRQGSTASVK